MDMVFSNALKKNYNLSNLLVKSYISWGTPQELLKWKKNSGKI